MASRKVSEVSRVVEESEDAKQPNKHSHCLGFGLSLLPRFDVPSAEGSRRQCSS
jgi:hypothetical protein